MASIFISHSKQDNDAKHFLLEAFAGTKVKPILEEFEPAVPSGVSATKIANDIKSANAVFVLLSETVQQLAHTRDWINWECGTAVNKDIWIFEPFEAHGRINIVAPRLTHFVRYSLHDSWRNYIRTIIDCYDDSHVFPTLAGTAGTGAAFGKDPVAGALVGLSIGVAGLILHGMAKPTLGIGVNCWNCKSTYKVHLPTDIGDFRCATCNSNCRLALQQPKLATV